MSSSLKLHTEIVNKLKQSNKFRAAHFIVQPQVANMSSNWSPLHGDGDLTHSAVTPRSWHNPNVTMFCFGWEDLEHATCEAELSYL